jgi:DNA-binding transcriptional regulator YiaG
MGRHFVALFFLCPKLDKPLFHLFLLEVHYMCDIKRKRREAKLSQKEFGRSLGISRQAVSSYETNKTPLPENTKRLVEIIYPG